MTQINRPFVESLECRQFLSVAPISAAIASAGNSPHLAHVIAKAKPVITTTPSLIHNYFGKIRTQGIIFGLGSRKLDFTLLITGQTISTLTGHFSVGNNASGDATLHGFEKTNGNFSFSTDANGFTFKIAGRVTKNGLRLGGNASIDVSGASVFKTSGGFVVNATS